MAIGKNNPEKAVVYANSALLLSFILGGVITLVGTLTTPYLSLIGASGNILPYAEDYALYIYLAAPFTCASFVLNSILRSVGQVGKATIGLLVGGLFNLFFDPLFIFVLDLGIKGAAICTMIGQILSFAIFFVIFIKSAYVVKLDLSKSGKRINVYLDIVRTGSPTAFRQGLGSVATALLNAQAALAGEAAVAAISIATKIYALVRSVIIGIGQGFQPIAGFNYGAKRYERVKSVFKRAVFGGTVLMIAITILIFFFKENVIAFFRADEEVIEIAAPALLFACVSFPTLAYSTFVNQTYQCLGFSFTATILASMRQGIFFVPVLFIACRFSILNGIRLAQPAADILTFFASIPFQIYFFKKRLTLKAIEPPD